MGRGRDIGVPALVLAFLLLAPVPAEADFRFDEGVYLGSSQLLADWADTLARARRQAPAVAACIDDEDRCDGRMRGVHTIVARARDLDLERQIRLVNRYVNNHRYRRDRTGRIESTVAAGEVRVRSRWSTLSEFMRRGGDCEDYATSKYMLLRELGIPAADLRVVVVFDRSTREHHALLAVRQEDGSAWLLDSDDRVYRGQPFGYQFVYSLNETSVWDHERSAAQWSQLLRSQPEDAS